MKSGSEMGDEDRKSASIYLSWKKPSLKWINFQDCRWLDLLHQIRKGKVSWTPKIPQLKANSCWPHPMSCSLERFPLYGGKWEDPTPDTPGLPPSTEGSLSSWRGTWWTAAAGRSTQTVSGMETETSVDHHQSVLQLSPWESEPTHTVYTLNK